MEYLDELSKSIDAINQGLLQSEIEKGKALQNEAEELFQLFTREGFNENVTQQHLQLLQKMLDFEKELVNFEILNFLYAIIARVALNAGHPKIAVAYALAGIDTNTRQDDTQGVTVNRNVLVDTACSQNAFKTVIDYVKQYPDACEPDIIPMLQGMESQNDLVIQELFKTKERPKSLRFLLDDKALREEKAIRSVMLQMSISRKEAMKYKAQAEELKNHNIP